MARKKLPNRGDIPAKISSPHLTGKNETTPSEAHLHARNCGLFHADAGAMTPHARRVFPGVRHAASSAKFPKSTALALARARANALEAATWLPGPCGSSALPRRLQRRQTYPGRIEGRSKHAAEGRRGPVRSDASRARPARWGRGASSALPPL